MNNSLRLTRTMGPSPSLTTSRGALAARERLVLTYRGKLATVSSEAAPLPGYGDDDLELAFSELSQIRREDLVQATEEVERAFVARRDERAQPQPPGQPLPVWHAAASLAGGLKSPAARCCIEVLVLRVAAASLERPLVDLLSSRPVAQRLKTSAVLDPRDPTMLKQAVRYLESGVFTFKVKCGLDASSELRSLTQLCTLDQTIRLRVDANGAWTKEAATEFIQEAVSPSIQWFEDPTMDLSEWAFIKRRVPDALLVVDEPLVGRTPEGRVLDLVDGVVLKPMALGGLSTALSWGALAHRLGRIVCVSHLFDGPLSLEAYIALAFSVQTPTFAAGLGLHSGIAFHEESRIRGLRGSELTLR